MQTDVKVLILEDHEIVASALEDLIENTFKGSQVERSNSFTKGTKMLQAGLKPDLVILDVNLPGGSSYGMIEILRNIQPGIRILIFTADEEHRHALQFLSAGANGFLSKNASTDEIINAMQKVLGDKKFMTEEVQQKIADNFFNKITPNNLFGESVLSPREIEVLDLLLEGKQTKEIASELNLKLTTISTHKSRIFEKMQVSNVIELFQKMNPKT